MGVIGRLFGIENHKLSMNAVLVQHLIEISGPEAILDILHATVHAASQSNHPRLWNASASKALEELGKYPRAVQMQFIAYGCAQAGIRPRVKGCDFYHVKNPFWARDVTAEHINASIIAVRRYGTNAIWPGNSPLDLVDLYASSSNAVAPDQQRVATPDENTLQPNRGHEKSIVQKSSCESSDRFVAAERAVSNVFVKQLIITKQEFFRVRKVSATPEKHLRALIALDLVTHATLWRLDATVDDPLAFLESSDVIMSIADQLETWVVKLAIDAEELGTILDCMLGSETARFAGKISGSQGLLFLKHVTSEWAISFIGSVADEFRDQEPTVALAMAAYIFVEEFVLGERPATFCDETFELIARHVSAIVGLASLPPFDRKCA